MKTKGFTLIEIIVSLAIFSVVAVIAIGALVRVTSANRQAQAIQSGVNNVSFVLDAMSREMRVGTNYKCYSAHTDFSMGNFTGSCSGTESNSNDTVITFTTNNVDTGGCALTYAYLFHVPGNVSGATTTIEKAEPTLCSQLPGSIYAPFYPLTSQSVNVTDYHVGLYGGSGTSYPYSLVFVRLKGYVGVQIKDQSVFDVETTVSDRSQ